VNNFLNLFNFRSTPESTLGQSWWKGPAILRSLALLLVILWAGYFSYNSLRDQVMIDAGQSANESINDVETTLNMSNDFYLKQCSMAMGALRRETLKLGVPRLDAPIQIGDKTAPDLAFGATVMGNNFSVVDDIKELMGGTSTLFVRSGDDFVRVSTNVQTADGHRALGTILNPKGAAIGRLRQGQSFAGAVDILGKPFITEYDPITDAGGNVIGAWYVGYPIETLTDLMARIGSMHILEHGFVALLDNHQSLVAHSTHADTSAVMDIAKSVSKIAPGEVTTTAGGSDDTSTYNAVKSLGNSALDSDWRVHKVTYEPWGYTIIAATYVPDVMWRTFKVVWIGFFVMGVLGLSALAMQAVAMIRVREMKAKAEAAQQAAEEANRTKSAFLANMSHELRTPLNAIIGYSEMIIEDATEAIEEIVPDMEKIRGAGKHLLALINDILDLSKIEAGKMTLYLEDFAVIQMVQDVASTIRPLLEKNSNELEIIGQDEDLGIMHGDLTKTRQVLFNLLSNASKFTQNGKIRLAVERSGSRFTFRITDSGIGMTPEQIGKLFKEFSQADDSTTRKFGGTGLGLAICKRFCEMMGGAIDVTSTPGVGSTFTVTLPVKTVATAETQTKKTESKPAPAVLPTQISSPGANEAPCVLVVDDDPAVLDLLRRILEKEHYRVATASSGQQAIELCATLKPCLITLDVMMPELDGWATLKKLKNDPATAEIPVVMVTMVDDKPLGLALGAADYVTKPFERDQILQILQRRGIRLASPQVLIVDDDPSVYRNAAAALEKDGFKTSYAPNGRVALDMVADARPDLIVLDLMMPEMNGIDFLSELRRRGGNDPSPVVIFSAKDLTDSEAQLLRLSTRETLIKGPQSTLDLVAAVKRVLT